MGSNDAMDMPTGKSPIGSGDPPPPAVRHVAILTFTGCQILDVTGPAAVFSAANDGIGARAYEVHVLSAAGGEVRTSSTVTLATRPIAGLAPEAVDTLLVAGGGDEGLQSLIDDPAVRAWVTQASAASRRFGSICTGTFVLAHFGLVGKRRVATHWSKCGELAQTFPEATVDAEALFVNEGRLWTSAGVTTGIDMSLDLVASDLGYGVAHWIAKRLVLHARRPGYQSQFSPVLLAQGRADAPFAPLIEWMRAHLDERLDLPTLAARVAMSDRTFQRKFAQCMGETPAHFVETLRLDRTRDLLAGPMSLKEIADRTGYGSAGQLSKAFERRYGMTPVAFRATRRDRAAEPA